MYITLKNMELLKHFKIRKTAPTCCSLQENRQQGATASTSAKIMHLVQSGNLELVQNVSVMAAYCGL
jgi:hypothetical protein